MDDDTDEYSVRTPDGCREVIRMITSIPARPNQVSILRGAGLAPRVCVGSPGLSADDWLRIVNRDHPGRGYDHVDFVAMGMVRLDPALTSVRGDQWSSGQAGATVGEGTMNADEPLEDIREIAMPREDAGPTATWLVTDATGPQLLAYPILAEGGSNSGELAQLLEPITVGRFTVERIDTATLLLAPDPYVRGWALAVDPGQAPSLSPH